MFYVHWDLAQGARIEMPLAYPERAAYVAVGAVAMDGRVVKAGEMAALVTGCVVAFFVAGNPAALRALEPSLGLALGGEPLGRRFIEWNFVSSSKERIEQAKADWRAGRMKLPDLDHAEFIPLPGDGQAPANPMS